MGIAEKLRAAYQDDTDPLCWSAADEIDRLQAAMQHEKDVAEAYKAEAEAMRKDADRYRILRRGQHWSVINGIGDELRANDLDAAINAVMKGQ